MKPAQILNKSINAVGYKGQLTGRNVAETATQTLWNLKQFARSDRNEQASNSMEIFTQSGRNLGLATLPLMPAENCPYAEGGQDCRFRCALCSLRHECIYCGLKDRQETNSICVPPFGNPYERPATTLASQFKVINNDQEYYNGTSDEEGGRISPNVISAVQLKELSRGHWEEYAAVKDISPQTRLTDWLDDSDQEHQESVLDGSEYDEEEIVSQAESDLLAGYACILCDDPDDAEDMVACDLDSGWFHLSCVGLDSFPVGEWCCPFCIGTPSGRAEKRATSSRSSSVKEISSRLQSIERAISSPEKSQPASSNLPFIQNAAKGQTLSAKRPNSAIRNLPSSLNVPKKENWKVDEMDQAVELMREVVEEGERTERKWTIVSHRFMSRYAVDRSAGSIKNWWNRHGRAMSKIDERIVPKPDKLKTGATSPEKRRKERQSSKRRAESVDDDHVGPRSGSRKRQKSNTSQSGKTRQKA